MQLREGERASSGEPHVGYGSADPDGAVLDALEARYRVTRAETPGDLVDDVDCLVVDGDDFGRIDASRTDPSTPESVPVVVVAGDDPRLTRAVARRPGVDLVYLGSVSDDLDGPLSDRLCDRVDAACREAGADLEGPILEVAGLLMSAAPDEVDTRIEWGLRTVGEALGANRCALYEVDEEALSVTHGWADAGSLAHGSVPKQAFPGFESSLARFDPFVATEGSRRAEELGYGDGSFVAVPVVIDWEIEWVLAFGGVPGRSVPESALRDVGTFGDLIGHTLRRDRHRREIERQNDRLERFASVIRHDLQNPLNVISGFADLAIETGEPAELERISAAATRMEAILEDLHTLVREADDLGEREAVSVSELVERAHSTVETGAASVEIEDVGIVEADPGRLRQAFENLIRNAVEHGSTGNRPEADDSVEHGSTGSRAEPDDSVEHGDVSIRISATADGFAIEDDGPGIPAEDRDRIFEEGYTEGGGTGLGLSIVRTVIEAHGWEVSATESSLGGARFEVSGVEFVDDDTLSTTAS